MDEIAEYIKEHVLEEFPDEGGGYYFYPDGHTLIRSGVNWSAHPAQRALFAYMSWKEFDDSGKDCFILKTEQEVMELRKLFWERYKRLVDSLIDNSCF